MSIKYYHLAKDEELPEEFCAVRDIGGEPSEYTFYVPESENAKLRELVNDMRACFRIGAERDGVSKQWCYELFDSYTDKLRELGIEVD